ncbi:MAG: hypothetical protein GY928_13675 [Colwellia sp.]|nr:hypothetical protein [Colwellia sp.]
MPFLFYYILLHGHVVYSGYRYYRPLRGVLIEELITFNQDSRLSDYRNDESEPCT